MDSSYKKHGIGMENKYQPSIDELITLRQASEFSGLTTSHLRRLLGKQKAWGKKFGGTWVTTEYAMKTYLASNPRPGPKSKKQLVIRGDYVYNKNDNNL